MPTFVGEKYLLVQKEPIELQNILIGSRVNGGIAFSKKPSLSLGMRFAFLFVLAQTVVVWILNLIDGFIFKDC